MKTTTHRSTAHRGLLLAMIASVLLMTSYSPTAAADHGSFVGGMVAGHLIGGAVRRDQQRTDDANQMAAQQAAAPAAPAQLTPQQRIQQLDKLAAGGYITPAEYKAKKQAIIDSM